MVELKLENLEKLTALYPKSVEIIRRLIRLEQQSLAGHKDKYTHAIFFKSNKAFSCLHLIPTAAFEKGLREMEREVQSRPITGVSRYLLLWGTK